MAHVDNMQAERLTTLRVTAKGATMTRTPMILMLAAAAAIAGCNKADHTIVAGDPPEDGTTNASANGPVALPPAILATKLYRCADNSVVTVDYLSDGKSANVHVGKAAAAVQVTAAEAGQPMTAEGGYSVEGSAGAPSAKIAVPGHAAQTCKA